MARHSKNGKVERVKMRLKTGIKEHFITYSADCFPKADVYLFGSRVDDNAKGGDIDLLLLSNKKIESSKLRKFRIDFYKIFGWRKIDLVNFTRASQDVFKMIALSDAVLLRKGEDNE
jgi:predicted nucleotidyltransferase